MDFNTKARVFLILRNHFDKFLYNFSALYWTEISVPRVSNLIVNEVTSSIPDIVNRSSDFESFEKNLKEETFKVVSTIVTPDSSTWGRFTDRRLNSYYDSLDNRDKEIFWSLILTCLSGYEKENDNKINFSNIRYDLKKISIINRLDKFGYNVKGISRTRKK